MVKRGRPRKEDVERVVKKEPDNDLLWRIARDSWRVASSLGTALFILIAVGLHVYSWLYDQPSVVDKAVRGVVYAMAYFVFAVIAKAAKEWNEV